MTSEFTEYKVNAFSVDFHLNVKYNINKYALIGFHQSSIKICTSEASDFWGAFQTYGTVISEYGTYIQLKFYSARRGTVYSSEILFQFPNRILRNDSSVFCGRVREQQRCRWFHRATKQADSWNSDCLPTNNSPIGSADIGLWFYCKSHRFYLHKTQLSAE